VLPVEGKSHSLATLHLYLYAEDTAVEIESSTYFFVAGLQGYSGVYGVVGLYHVDKNETDSLPELLEIDVTSQFEILNFRNLSKLIIVLPVALDVSLTKIGL